MSAQHTPGPRLPFERERAITLKQLSDGICVTRAQRRVLIRDRRFWTSRAAITKATGEQS